MTVNVHLDHLVEAVFFRCPHCKATLFPPFPYRTSGEKVTMSSWYLRSGKLGFYSLRVEYLHKLLGILLKESLSLHHLRIQPFIAMDSWRGMLFWGVLFVSTSGCNLILLHFVVQVAPPLALGALSVGSCISLTFPINVGLFFTLPFRALSTF